MTIKGLLIVSLCEWAFLALMKIIFLNLNLFQNSFWVYLYLILTLIISAIFIRRLGFINYLEALVVCLAWLTLFLFLDYIITNYFLTTPVFSHNYVYISYALMAATILFFGWIGNTGLVLGFTGATVLFLFLDAVLGNSAARADAAFQNHIWIGYGAMMASVIIFHKKRHIQVRNELHAKHGEKHH